MSIGVSVPDAGPDLDKATIMDNNDISFLDLERADVVDKVLVAETFVDIIILEVNDVGTSIFIDEISTLE